MTATTTRLDYDTFRQMDFAEDDNHIYELLNGVLVKKSAPSVKHQRLVKKLFRLIDAFVEKNNIGEVLFSPIDVKLDDYNVPQPDLLFVSKERAEIVREDEGYVDGPPDLVIEVLSPGSVKRDRIEKKALYAAHGVKEYWLADPLHNYIEVYVLREGKFELEQFADQEEDLKSLVLTGFSLKVVDLF